MTTTTIDQSTAKLLLRHFEAVTEGFESASWTVNPADPTTVVKMMGWVTFLYDPWKFDLGDDFEGPDMMTSYHLTIHEQYGVYFIDIAEAMEDERWATKSKRISLTLTDLVSTEQADWQELNRLLDGSFHKTQAEADQHLFDLTDEHASDFIS